MPAVSAQNPCWKAGFSTTGERAGVVLRCGEPGLASPGISGSPAPAVNRRYAPAVRAARFYGQGMGRPRKGGRVSRHAACQMTCGRLACAAPSCRRAGRQCLRHAAGREVCNDLRCCCIATYVAEPWSRYGARCLSARGTSVCPRRRSIRRRLRAPSWSG